MPSSFRSFARFGVLLLFLLLAARAAAEAPSIPDAPPPSPLEQRLRELEGRLTSLEKALALSSIDVPGVAARAGPSVVNIFQVNDDREVLNRGTGFLWSADGQIITSAHVVPNRGAKTLVTFTNGKMLEAETLLFDAFLDLAILDVAGSNHPYLRFARERPAVGAPIVVIGNAFGYRNSVTFGIVSGTDRPSPYHAVVHYPSLQIDAAINHGNSGGPILNGAGEVVAIASWTEGKQETDGIAFGIPADLVRATLERWDPERGIVRPWLGIAVQEPYWVRGGLPDDSGLLVTDLHPDGAAARAGLQRLDYITRVNGVAVNQLLELRRELEKAAPGETVALAVERLTGESYVLLRLLVVTGEFSAKTPALIPNQGYDPTTDDLF